MQRTRPSRVSTPLISALSLGLMSVACGGTAPKPLTAQGPTVAPAPVHIRTENVGVTWSTKATLKLESPWAKCHAAFVVGNGDAKGEVARLAQGCAEATGMHRAFEPFTGEQKAADKPQTFTWKARKGHCYRAYGAAVPSIKNLDLLLQDSEGVVLGQDSGDDNAPVALDAGGACFKVDDEAAVVVSVGDGSGTFAVEVWED